MTKASNKEILRLAIPNIVSNISIPLLSTVDTLLMGQLSSLHLGAIGLGGMIFNFVYWNFGFLRMGTTGLTAQAYGANDAHRQVVTLVRGLILALLLAMLIFSLQSYLLEVSAWFFAVGDTHYELVRDYFITRMWAAPATMMMYVMMGWFFGMQNAWYPMFITIIINVINILVSYLLVFIYGMDIIGVALGTVIAQYVGLILCTLVILWRYKEVVRTGLQKGILKASLHVTELMDFFKVNGNLFVRTFCLTFVFAYFYRESTIAGALALAANVILLQFVNWMSYGIDGFAYAAESLVGKYAGAKDVSNLKKAIRLSFVWGLILALVYSVLYYFGYDTLLHMFSNDRKVLAFSQNYQLWIVLFPLIAFACYIWDGIFIGLLASRQMRDAMLVSLIIFVAAYHFIETNDPLVGLWIAMLAFMAARGVLLSLLYLRLDKSKVEQ